MLRRRQGGRLAGGEGPVFTEVLAQGKDKAAIRMPGHSAETVVRVVGDGVERRDVFFEIRLAIAVAVFNPQNAPAFGQIDPTVGAEDELHRGCRFIVKDAAIFAFFVKNEDLVLFRPRVAFGWEVGVAGDQVNGPIVSDIDPRGGHEIRMFCEHRQLNARQQGLNLRQDFVRDDGCRGGRSARLSAQHGGWREESEKETLHRKREKTGGMVHRAARSIAAAISRSMTGRGFNGDIGSATGVTSLLVQTLAIEHPDRVRSLISR